jgi:ABC-2 type transport system permease protein
MKDFVRQLRWEIQKLWWRPRTYLGFAVTFAFELLLCLLWSLPSVRAVLAKEIWKTHVQVEDAFSGLTIAVHLTGETMAMMGMLFLGLIASDVIAKEIEDGTLRLALCRPVGRTSVFAQKVMSCAVYTVALTLFVGINALVLGLVFAGGSPRHHVAFRESILTVLGFQTGLAQYFLAMVMLFRPW